MEAASGRRSRRVRHLTGKCLGKPALAVGARDGFDEGLGVRVQRRLPKAARGGRLDHKAQVHHGDDVGDVANDREIMRYQQEANVLLAGQLLQEVCDLRLRRSVERR